MRAVVACIAVAVALTVAAPIAFAEPPETHEILSERPSGFWTSNRPAEGGAYRYRLMIIGVAIAGVMGIVIWRVLKSSRNP